MAVFDPLVLQPAAESLWLDFQAKRRLPVRAPAIVRHWQRSRKIGAPHDGPRPEDALRRGADLRHRTERVEPLLACGQGVLRRVANTAAANDYALLVSDHEGVIVWAAGGGHFAKEARQVRLMEGAHWDEATRGTNAIGTALVEARPVFVQGGAHFARPYHQLVCYAAPIRNAAGEIVAVLDATSVLERAESSMGFGVIAAAQALEELLRARAYSLAGATVTRALARSLERMNCPVAVIEPPGRVSRLNAPARKLFGAASTHADVEALLGRSFAELAACTDAQHDEVVELPQSSKPYRIRVEPIESGGQLIALLTFLEPSAARSSRPAAKSDKPTATPKSAAVKNAASKITDADPFANFFAEDDATRATLDWAKRLAPSDIPMMLLAETGAGKELVARGIHRASRRANGPFIAVNCGSIAPSLLEAELFGYAPGAFTGAQKRGHSGYLQAASGGTLFLDEVAEMPLGMQAALLRVLEGGDYNRVGEPQPRYADVRVVCATCRDLPALVKSGSFRNDLYFRLKGATVTLPPLRARTDIVALAQHLLRASAGQQGRVPAPTLADDVAAFLPSFNWPGNVRELKSTLEVAVVLAGSASEIRLEHLPPDIRGEPNGALAQSLDDVQSHVVRRVLAEVAGNVSLAAKRLGVARSTLYRMMRRYGLGKDR